MSDISDERLQEYLDGALSPAESEEIEVALAAFPELHAREEAMREEMADCAYMFAAVSDIDAQRLLRMGVQSPSKGAARSVATSGWMRRAAALLIVAGSGAALWTVWDRAGGGATDVDRITVTIPGARQVASAVDVVAGEKVLTTRFALASGALVDIAIAGERGRSVLRGAPDSQVSASRSRPHVETSGGGSIVSWTDESGYVVRISAPLPPDELLALAEQIALSRQR